MMSVNARPETREREASTASSMCGSGTPNANTELRRAGLTRGKQIGASELARPTGLVPDAFDDEGLAVRNGPSPNPDCSPGVPLTPVVYCRLARSMSAENVARFDVDDLVHATRPIHT